MMLREGVVDDVIFTVYLCETCQEVQRNFEFMDEEFCFGDLLEDALEYEKKEERR